MTTPTRPTRRTVVSGAAWTVPVVAIAATAPTYAASPKCDAEGGIVVGPITDGTPVRAICNAQSQFVNPGTIKAEYAYGLLPRYITIRTCLKIAGTYRFRETDTLSEFQVEVDGRHSDQNSATQGYRPPFALALDPQGPIPAERTFPLTYRTSEARPTSRTDVSITITLQRLVSGNAGQPNAVWEVVDTITIDGDVRRRVGQSANFNACSAGGTNMAVTGTSSE